MGIEDRDIVDARPQPQPQPQPPQAPTGFSGPLPNPISAGLEWFFPVLGTRDKGGPATAAGTYEYSNSYAVARDNSSGIHGAIDIYAPEGAEIKLPVDGEVLRTSGPNGSGGWTVTFKGVDGYTYYFAHMKGPALYNAGDQLKGNTTIGHVGRSGNAGSSKPHLHFSMSNASGQKVNPYWFLENGVQGYSTVPDDGSGSNPPGGDGSQEFSDNAFGLSGEGAIVLPLGGAFYTVGGTKYVAYSIKGIDGAEPAWVYFEIPSGVDTPSGQSLSQAEWEQKTTGENWQDAGSADAFRGVKSGQSWDEMLKTTLMQMGYDGSQALADPEVLEVIALFIARPSMSETELKARLDRTTWGQTHTDAEKRWDDKSAAQQDQDLIEKASMLAGTWFTYVGKNISIQMYDQNGDSVISPEELKAGNPGLYQAAMDWASGVKTEREIIETWIKPAALENTDGETPWQRVLRQEEAAQGQFESDTENQAGTVQQLYRDYGIPISWDEAVEIGRQVEMNEKSIAEIEEELDAQAMALYPGKPKGVKTSTWASPYMNTFSNLLELGTPTLENPLIQKALSSGMTIGDFETEVRNDPRWMDTNNARDTHYTQIGALGRQMGF